MSQNEILFVQLVSMFQVAALQHMGKLPNPVTNAIERDMEQARISVDMLGMIKEKTKGNLNKNEEEFLHKVVFESQMNYLDELKKPEEQTEDEGTEGRTDESAQTADSSEKMENEPPEDASGEAGTDDGADTDKVGG
ncbi:MAG: DUF1844 domain-containing protein [Candidatus Latescibacterota bacterium]|nr:MAG: DUF1844 domain-containing protein [Candidatus Latescibacterota bacterium]